MERIGLLEPRTQTVALTGVQHTVSPRLLEILALLVLKAEEIDAISTGSVEIRFDRGHVHRSLILGRVVNVDREATSQTSS